MDSLKNLQSVSIKMSWLNITYSLRDLCKNLTHSYQLCWTLCLKKKLSCLLGKTLLSRTTIFPRPKCQQISGQDIVGQETRLILFIHNGNMQLLFRLLLPQRLLILCAPLLIASTLMNLCNLHLRQLLLWECFARFRVLARLQSTICSFLPALSSRAQHFCWLRALVTWPFPNNFWTFHIVSLRAKVVILHPAKNVRQTRRLSKLTLISRRSCRHIDVTYNYLPEIFYNLRQA